MANPDPRRGDEPGDPNVTPMPSQQPEPKPAAQDKPDHDLENDDDLRAGQYGPTDQGDTEHDGT